MGKKNRNGSGIPMSLQDTMAYLNYLHPEQKEEAVEQRDALPPPRPQPPPPPPPPKSLHQLLLECKTPEDVCVWATDRRVDADTARTAKQHPGLVLAAKDGSANLLVFDFSDPVRPLEVVLQEFVVDKWIFGDITTTHSVVLLADHPDDYYSSDERKEKLIQYLADTFSQWSDPVEFTEKCVVSALGVCPVKPFGPFNEHTVLHTVHKFQNKIEYSSEYSIRIPNNGFGDGAVKFGDIVKTIDAFAVQWNSACVGRRQCHNPYVLFQKGDVGMFLPLSFCNNSECEWTVYEVSHNYGSYLVGPKGCGVGKLCDSLEKHAKVRVINDFRRPICPILFAAVDWGNAKEYHLSNGAKGVALSQSDFDAIRIYAEEVTDDYHGYFAWSDY